MKQPNTIILFLKFLKYTFFRYYTQGEFQLYYYFKLENIAYKKRKHKLSH